MVSNLNAKMQTKNLPLEEIPMLFGDDIATADITQITKDNDKLDLELAHREDIL